MAPRPRTLRRRILRWTLVLFSVLTALVVVALLLLHTDWARDKVRSTIEGQLQKRVNGTVTIGALEGDMLDDIVLKDVVVRDQYGNEAIKIGRLRLDFKLRPLLDRHFHAETLEVDKLEISARRGPDGKPILATLWKEQPKTDDAPWSATLENIRIRGSLDVEQTGGLVERFKEVAIDGALRVAEEGTSLELEGVKAHWVNRRLNLGASGSFEMVSGGGLAVREMQLVAGTTTIHIPFAHRDQNGIFASFEAAVTAADVRALAPGVRLTGSGTLAGFASQPGPDAPIRLVAFGAVGGAALGAVVDAALPPAALSADGAAFFSGAEPHLIWGGAPAGRITGWASGRYAGADLASASARLELGARGGLQRVEVDSLRVSAALDAGRAKADVSVVSPIGNLEADAAVRLPAAGEAPDALAIESAHATGLIKNVARVERLLGRPPTASGPLAFKAAASGSPRDLAVELHTQTPRLSRQDLHLLSLEVDVDLQHLPHRPQGTIAVRTRDVVKGKESQGPARVTAELEPGGQRATATFAAGGRDGFAASGTAVVDGLTSGAPRIELPTLAIKTRALDWKGSGRLAIGAGGQKLSGGVDLTSRAGTVGLDAAIVRRGATLHGPVDLTADVDVGQLADAFGVAPKKLGQPSVQGKATLRAHVVLPAGPGTVEADLTAASWDGLKNASASLRAKMAGRRLEAVVEAKVDTIGAVRAVAHVDTPRALTDGRAWKRMSANAIDTVTIDADKIDLAALAGAVGEKRLEAGTAKLHAEIGRGLKTGKLTVEMSGTRVQPKRDLELVFDGRAGLDLAADRIGLEVRVDGKRRGQIALDATVDRPARPFDPAAWRQAGVQMIRSVELRATRIDLAQFEPAAPGKPAVVQKKEKRGRLPDEVLEKPRIDLRGTVDLELSVGPRGEIIAGRIGLAGVRARRFAVPISGELRLVANPNDTGATLMLETGGAPIVHGNLSTALGTRALLAARDPGALAARARTAPITADLAFPRQSVSRLAALAGKWQASGQFYGSITVRGTAAAPVVTAALRAPGLTAEGVRFDSLELDGRYRPSGWYARAFARQGGGGALKLEARHGSEALKAGGRPGDRLFVQLSASKFRIAFLSPLWNKPGGTLTHLDGVLNAKVSAGGTLDRPRVDGTIKLHEGEARLASMLRPLDRMTAKIAISGSVARINIAARSKPGRVQVEGFFAFNRPAASYFNLTVKARDLPVLAGSQLLSVKGDASASGRLQNRLWSVEARIAKGVVVRLPSGQTAELHKTGPLEDVTFVDPAGLAETEGRRAAKEASGVTGVRLKIRTDDRVVVRGDMVRTDLRVKLDVTMIDGKTAIHGTVDAVRGWVEIVGRRYDIERAWVIFAGEMPPDPRLDIRISHRFTQTTLYVDVAGHVSKPKITFASDSGQYDQAQLLAMVLGSEPGESQGDTDASHKATGAALAFAAGQVGTALKRSGLPIDAVKVGTEAGSERAVTYVTVGKWITDRMFVAYRRRFEAEVTENLNEGVFQHYFARDWMWEGAAGDRGTASFDLLWIVPF
jgi:hypothetical protein